MVSSSFVALACVFPSLSPTFLGLQRLVVDGVSGAVGDEVAWSAWQDKAMRVPVTGRRAPGALAGGSVNQEVAVGQRQQMRRSGNLLRLTYDQFR